MQSLLSGVYAGVFLFLFFFPFTVAGTFVSV